MHSTRKRLPGRLKLGLIGFMSLLCWSCLNPFAPALDKGNLAEDLITDQSTPEEVLTNFKYAYIFRDSLLYADLLDSSFVFQYFDPDQGASGIFVSWTRETDLKATGRLLRTFDAINLEWLNTINPDTLRNNAGTIESISFSKSFQLNLASSGFQFGVSGFALFTFRQSKADDKWRIVLWVDKSDL
ncbi:hypothetical protein L0337_23005 [candidate division KSB1 bacterium]|nr:hypothetical protein [candidate division KSB1 bacterium]